MKKLLIYIIKMNGYDGSSRDRDTFSDFLCLLLDEGPGSPPLLIQNFLIRYLKIGPLNQTTKDGHRTGIAANNAHHTSILRCD